MGNKATVSFENEEVILKNTMEKLGKHYDTYGDWSLALMAYSLNADQDRGRYFNELIRKTLDTLGHGDKDIKQLPLNQLRQNGINIVTMQEALSRDTAQNYNKDFLKFPYKVSLIGRAFEAYMDKK